MANTKNITSAFPFDQAAVQDGIKTWVHFNERFMGLALDALEKSTGIAAKTTEDAIWNLRDVTAVRNEPGFRRFRPEAFGSWHQDRRNLRHPVLKDANQSDGTCDRSWRNLR